MWLHFVPSKYFFLYLWEYLVWFWFVFFMFEKPGPWILYLCGTVWVFEQMWTMCQFCCTRRAECWEEATITLPITCTCTCTRTHTHTNIWWFHGIPLGIWHKVDTALSHKSMLPQQQEEWFLLLYSHGKFKVIVVFFNHELIHFLQYYHLKIVTELMTPHISNIQKNKKFSLYSLFWI